MAHYGYGEAGSGICARLSQNKRVAKGGQTVLCIRYGRRRPLSHLSIHASSKLYDNKKKGWSTCGPFELWTLQKELLGMVEGATTSTKKKLFEKKPCTTCDNYFINDKSLDWCGINGFGLIGTNARNRLPSDINFYHLYKGKIHAAQHHAKVARFVPPIVAVKNDPERRFQRVHVFTSICNIASVNALNECSNFVELREKGRKDNKRQWVLEMNHARRI